MASRGDPHRRSSSRSLSSIGRKYLLSGFTDHEKAQLAVHILNLGSKYLEVAEFTPDCSHIVTVKPMRSEKYLCACAAGKWLLTPDYIKDSAKAGHWLKEEQYQWGIRNIHKPIGQTSMARAPARWHRTVQETGKRAFDGWKVVILVENKKRKPAVYKRVIECGGGKVLSVKTPIRDADDLATQLTHALVDTTYEKDVMDTLVVRGIPCVSPDYIAEHLFEEQPDITKYSITKKSNQGMCQSIVTSGISSQQSSRRSSRRTSQKNSPLKVKQEQQCVTTTTARITKAASTLAAPTEQLSSETIRGTPTTIVTATSAIATKSNREKPCLETTTATKTTKVTAAPTRATAAPAIATAATRQQEKVTTAPATVSTRQQRNIAATRTLKGASATATAALSTPVKPPNSQTNSTPLLEIPRIPIAIDVHEVAETINKQQADSPFSIVPHWMQVTPPKHKSGDTCALPFPKVICNMIEACVEEGLWVEAVATVTNNLSVSKFPPSEILHIIMMEIMKSDSGGTLASSGYHMLKSVLCLHSPMASPSLGQIYLQSMLPPTTHIEGFELEEDTPIRSYWDFIDRVIRNSLTKLAPIEPVSKEDKQRELVTQMNNQLLLNYLVSVLEQDFKGYKSRNVSSKKTANIPASRMMSSVLWPTGQRKVNSHALRSLLEHFVTAVKQTTENENMCTLTRMLATLVSMSSELLNTNASSVKHASSTQDSALMELAYELVSIAKRVDLIDNVENIHIMLTVLEPSWLKLSVTEILLQEYDNCLVLPQYKNIGTHMLTLEKVVNYYFYLLPNGPDTTPSPNKSVKSPLKKTTKNPRMVNALQTIGDSNHSVKETPGQKRKLDSIPGSKVICSPSKKRKVMQINKRNAKGETQLHVACIKNDITKLRQLLASPGIQVNMTDYAGWTPLHEACNHGHVGCVKEMLKFKPKPNIMAFLDKDSKKAYGGIDLLAAPSECGTTPLHDAVQNGHIDIVRLLVKSGGKSVLMAKNAAGLTPQDLAIVEEMKQELQCSGVARQPNTRGQQTLEMSQSSQEEIVQGDTPLRTAVVKDNTEGIPLLGPSEELYNTVLGTPQKPKRFVTSLETEKYCTLVCHLVRAYVQSHKLADIKAEVDRRMARNKHHPHMSHDENSNLFFSPVGAVTLPLVKLRNIGRKTNNESDVKKALDKTLADDLYILNGIDKHLMSFIHHVGRIGPWVGHTDSLTCKAVFFELNMLAASWRSE